MLCVHAQVWLYVMWPLIAQWAGPVPFPSVIETWTVKDFLKLDDLKKQNQNILFSCVLAVAHWFFSGSSSSSEKCSGDAARDCTLERDVKLWMK